MQTVGLTWQHAFEVAGVLAVAGSAVAVSKNRTVRAVGAFARETAVIGVLYGLWQIAHGISTTDRDGAFRRGRWIADAERFLPLPSEHAVQHAFLGDSWIIQGANLYYASMHMTCMLLFLVWLFVRHRDRYRPIRQVMAWTTLCCLLLQLLPVAPPRMFPQLHIVDTGLLYHQSVYSNGLPIDQLSAMPSVHVAWACVIGWYAWQVSTSRWRWLGPAHAAATVFVVVVTGNHWWLDGVVAVAILVACAWAVLGVRRAWWALRARLLLRRVLGVEHDARAGEREQDAAGLGRDTGEAQA